VEGLESWQKRQPILLSLFSHIFYPPLSSHGPHRPQEPLHPQHSLTDISLRWWHANNNKPNKMARNWWSNRLTTGLVPGPRHSILLHELGIWDKRTRWRTTQHVIPHGAGVPNRGAKQESLSGHILSATSASSGEHHRECR
jgi:hypothetical protein